MAIEGIAACQQSQFSMTWVHIMTSRSSWILEEMPQVNPVKQGLRWLRVQRRMCGAATPIIDPFHTSFPGNWVASLMSANEG